MKKILIVLASKEFQDYEYEIPRTFFEKMGAEIKTISSTKRSRGGYGMITENDFFITDDIDVAHFDGIFWVGGGGCLDYANDKNAENLAWEFVQNNKVIGAICAAPRLLLQWGILKGRKFTGWNGDMELPLLAQNYSAIFEENNVITDGKIVTAEGPTSAQKFAEAYWKVMNS